MKRKALTALTVAAATLALVGNAAAADVMKHAPRADVYRAHGAHVRPNPFFQDCAAAAAWD